MPSPGVMAVLRGQRDHFPGAVFGADFRRGRYKLGRRQLRNPAQIPGWSFTRASAGYAETSGGVLVPFASGVPRITDKGLLVEEARTNKATAYANPTDLTNVTKSGDAAATLAVVSDTAALAAAGLSGVCTSGNVYLLDNSGGGSSAYAIIAGVTANTNSHAASAYCRGSGTGGPFVSGATVASNSISAAYQRITNVQTPSSGTNVLWVRAAPGSVVYFILCDLQEGAFATSYIATAGSSATRALDVAALAFVAPPVGTLVVRASSYAINTNSNMAFAATDGGTTSRIGLYLYPSFTGFLVRNGGVNQADINAAGSAANNTVYTWAGRYTANDFAACRDGGSVVTDVSGTVPSLTDLRFGALVATQPINGYVERAILYPRAFSDAELQAVTAA